MPQEDLPSWLVGLDCFNKTNQSMDIKKNVQDKQRKKTTTLNGNLLEEFQHKRKELSKQHKRRYPESKAELICRQAMASVVEQDQVDVPALMYSLDNYAHTVYHVKEPSDDGVLTETTNIDYTRKNISQGINDLKAATKTRQFFTDSHVPEHQRAASMWATSFSILEKINKMENVFPTLRFLFHDYKENVKYQRFQCASCCDAAKESISSSFDKNMQEKIQARVAAEKAHRQCVGNTFFNQFFVPICFVRRNAHFKDTCISESLITPIQLQQKDADDGVNHEKNLMDVHFLTILELINFALSSLEHLGTLNPFPSTTVYNLVEDFADEQEEKFALHKRKKAFLQKNQLRLDLPLAKEYDNWPEKMQYRFERNPNVNYKDVVKRARVAREQLQENETKRMQKEQFALELDEKERLQRYREMLDNNFSPQSLRDGLHDKFSEERIEVYQTFFPQQTDDNVSFSHYYALFNTKRTCFGETIGGCSSPIRALEQFFPDDFHFLQSQKLTTEFESYCNKNKQEILGGKGKQYLIDQSKTATLYAKYLINSNGGKFWNTFSLSKEMDEQLLANCEQKLSQQMDSPNFRAWSAMVLSKLDVWLEKLLTDIESEAEYWSKFMTGENVAQMNKPEQTFKEYEAKCVNLAPWLFEKRTQDKTLFERRSMKPNDHPDIHKLEEAMINFQFEKNCNRLWNVEKAAFYFNEAILMQKTDNFSSEDTCLTSRFGQNIHDRKLARLLVARKKQIGKPMLWSVCCEPLLQGTHGFAVEPGTDPWCHDDLFAPNQRRDMRYNPYVEFQSYLWTLLRGKWSSSLNDRVTQVTQMGSLIVDEFMRQKGIATPNSFSDGKYLLSDQYSALKTEPEPNSRDGIGARFRSIILQVEQYLRIEELVVEDNILKLQEDYGTSALEEARTSMLNMLGYSSNVKHERAFSPLLYEMSRPFLSLESCVKMCAPQRQERKNTVEELVLPEEKPITLPTNAKSTIIIPATCVAMYLDKMSKTTSTNDAENVDSEDIQVLIDGDDELTENARDKLQKCQETGFSKSREFENMIKYTLENMNSTRTTRSRSKKTS